MDAAKSPVRALLQFLARVRARVRQYPTSEFVSQESCTQERHPHLRVGSDRRAVRGDAIVLPHKEPV